MKNPPEAIGTPSFLHEEAGFRYSIAHQDFSDAIVDVLSLAFARAPMSAAVGLSAPQLRPLVASFVPECTTNGLSVIATPVDEPSTLAGVFICRDFKSPFRTAFWMTYRGSVPSPMHCGRWIRHMNPRFRRSRSERRLISGWWE